MNMTIPEFPVAWLPFVDSIVKATLVLGAAAAATTALRRAQAALRHLVWTFALMAALLMPALSVALPEWRVPLLTMTSMPQSGAAPTSPAPPPLRADPVIVAPAPSTDRAAGPSAAAPAASEEAPRAIAWPALVLAIWLAGALAIVGRVIVGLLAVQWMAWKSQRVLDAPWMKMAVALASEVGVSPNIMFLRSGRATMPMACGVLRPAVMMPADADGWQPDRLRIVLLHELAHVKRRDCLTHLVAQLACALHWFNPLAWVAARNVRTERERACDDLVLAAGTHGPDYADQLLEIARAMRADRYPALLAGASLAMAHRSQLEGRLMAILDPRVPHQGLSRLRAAAASLACCAAVVPVAALHPWDQTRTLAPVSPVVAQTAPVQDPPPAPAPAPQPAPLPARPVAAPSPLEEAVGGLAEAAAHGAVEGITAAIAGAHRTLEHEAHSRDHDVDDDQDAKGSAKGDPRTIAALTAALKDSDKEVRETAMHALVQLRDPSIYEPLVQALKDPAPDVREQAAFGLGQLRDKRAVEPLVAALKDDNADVREQAAFALGQLRDRSAAAALTGALKDENADVREQAIFALGQLRDPAAIEGLTLAMRDASPDVREQAAFALGQIRDKRAIEPLVSALKDSDADVREQAAFALGQIRDAAAVEALIVAMKDSAASVREQVAFALGQLRDPRAIDALTAALKDPQASVRQQAAFALGQLAR
jgi:HEAT repeat protein/beta-lactamase regulating signal transducer with metallopeptidase domain